MKQNVDDLSDAALQGLYPVERLKQLGWWTAKNNTVHYRHEGEDLPTTYFERALATTVQELVWKLENPVKVKRSHKKKTFWQRVKAVFV